MSRGVSKLAFPVLFMLALSGPRSSPAQVPTAEENSAQEPTAEEISAQEPAAEEPGSSEPAPREAAAESATLSISVELADETPVELELRAEAPVELDDETAAGLELVTEAPVEPVQELSTADRLHNLELRLAEQQGQLDEILTHLDHLGTTLEQQQTEDSVTGPTLEQVSAQVPDFADFGNPVHVERGEVVEEAVAFGAPVLVDGTVRGDVVSFGADVRVNRSGHVQGDAVSFGGKVKVRSGGRVDGDRVTLASSDVPSSASGLALLAEKGSSWFHAMVRRTVMLLCLAGIGVLVLGLFPDKVRNVARGLELHPFRYGVAGLLLSCAGVVVSLLLAVTFIGLPVSVFVLLLLGLAWLLGFVALGRTLGHVFPMPKAFEGGLGPFLAGVLLLAAISLIPYVGKLVLFLSLFPCVGAAIGTRFGNAENG